MRALSGLALAVAVAFDPQVSPAYKQGPADHAPMQRAAPTVKMPEPERELSAPPDVTVVVSQEGSAIRLSIKRPGYVVALRSREHVSVAQDWVSALVAGFDGRGLEMQWETTDPRSLETVRGGLRIVGGTEGPTVDWFSLPDPVVFASRQDRLHACRAHASGDGYTVLCKVGKSARKLSVSNVTDETLLSNVWMSSGETHVVRLDLPLSEGEAPARMMSYLDGITAIVVRAEASWVRGEERPSMALFAATRGQPIVPWSSKLLRRPIDFF